MTFNELITGDKVYCISDNDADILEILMISRENQVFRDIVRNRFIHILKDSDWNSSVGLGIDNNQDKALYYVPDKPKSKSSEICKYWGDERLNLRTPLFVKSVIVTPSSINFRDDLFHIQIDGTVTRENMMEIFFLAEINGRGAHVIKTTMSNEDRKNPWVYVKTVAKVNSNTEYHIAALTPECMNRGVVKVLKEVLVDNLDEIDRLNKFSIKLQNKIDNFEELGEFNNYESISKFN